MLQGEYNKPTIPSLIWGMRLHTHVEPNYGQKELCSLDYAIAFNVELSDKECELTNN